MPDLSQLAPALEVATPEALAIVERYARAHGVAEPSVLDEVARYLAGWLESSRGALEQVPTVRGDAINSAYAPELGAVLESWPVEDAELEVVVGAASSTDLLTFLRETLRHDELGGPLASLAGAAVWERRLQRDPRRCARETFGGVQLGANNLAVRLQGLGVDVQRVHERVATGSWASGRRIVLMSGHPDPSVVHDVMDDARRALGWDERLLVFAPFAGPSSMFDALRPGVTVRDDTVVVRMQLRDTEPLLYTMWGESSFAEMIETGFWIEQTVAVPTTQFLLSAQHWRLTDDGLAVPNMGESIATLRHDTRQPHMVTLAGGESVLATADHEEPAILSYYHGDARWECTVSDEREVHVRIAGQPQMARSVAHWSMRLLRADAGDVGHVSIAVDSSIEVRGGLATVRDDEPFAPLTYTYDRASGSARIQVAGSTLIELGDDRDAERHLVNTVASILADAGLLDGTDTARLVDEVRPVGGPQHYNVNTRSDVSAIEHAAMPGPSMPRSERARDRALERVGEHASSSSAIDVVSAAFELLQDSLGRFDRDALLRLLVDALGRSTALEFHNARTSFDYVGLYGSENGDRRYLELEPMRVRTAMSLRALLELAQCSDQDGTLTPHMGDIIDLVELADVLIEVGTREDVRRANEQLGLDSASDAIQDTMLATIQRWVSGGARTSRAFNTETAPDLSSSVVAELDAAWETDIGLTFTNVLELFAHLIDVSLPPGLEYRRISVADLRDALGWSDERWATVMERFALPVREERIVPGVAAWQFFPWRQGRGWSLLRRPIVDAGDHIVVGRRVVSTALRIFLHEVGTGRRFVGTRSEKVASQISNRRGDVFAQEVLELARPHSDFAQANVKTVNRTRLKVDGNDIGDVDVLARRGEIVFVLEAKSFSPGKAPNTIGEEARKLHDPGDPKGKSAIAKHQRRVEWLEQHRSELALHVGVNEASMRMVAAVVLPGSSIPTQITDFATPIPVLGVDALIDWMRDQS